MGFFFSSPIYMILNVDGPPSITVGGGKLTTRLFANRHQIRRSNAVTNARHSK